MGFSANVLGIRTDRLPNCVLFWQRDVNFLFTAGDHIAPFSLGLVKLCASMMRPQDICKIVERENSLKSPLMC